MTYPPGGYVRVFAKKRSECVHMINRLAVTLKTDDNVNWGIQCQDCGQYWRLTNV